LSQFRFYDRGLLVDQHSLLDGLDACLVGNLAIPVKSAMLAQAEDSGNDTVYKGLDRLWKTFRRRRTAQSNFFL